MHKKNLYLILLTIITIASAIIGILIHVIIPAGSWFADFDEHYDSDDFIAGSTTYEELDAFQSIDFDINVADITITSGDTYSISYQTRKKALIPSYEIKDGTLYVKQAPAETLHGLTHNTSCTLMITVPKNTVLSQITGKSAVGDFTMENTSAIQMDVSVNVGDTELTDVVLQQVTIGSDVGNISLEDVTFDIANLTSNVGDVDVDVTAALSLDDFQMDLSCGFGEIEVNDNSYHEKYQSNIASEKSLTVSTGTGDIDISY